MPAHDWATPAVTDGVGRFMDARNGWRSAVGRVGLVSVQAEMELDNRAMTRQVIELSQQVARLYRPT